MTSSVIVIFQKRYFRKSKLDKTYQIGPIKIYVNHLGGEGLTKRIIHCDIWSMRVDLKSY